VFPVGFFNVRKFGILFGIILLIHLKDLLLGRRSHNLNNLNQLINLTITQKGRLPINHLNKNAPGGPHINLTGIISGPKDQLRRPIAPTTNIRKIRLTYIKIFIPLTSCLADPKSQITTLFVWGLTRTLCGFMSRWEMEHMDMYIRPRRIW
jgi:hypothetical protein